MPERTKKILAHRLNDEMRKQGLDQKQLAKISGVSQPYISQILSGRAKDPGVSYINALETALGVYSGFLTETEKVRQERLENLKMFAESQEYQDLGISDEEYEELRRKARWISPEEEAPIIAWVDFVRAIRGLKAKDASGDNH